MRIGVFAPTVITGGGLTHLRELISRWSPGAYGCRELLVWAHPSVSGLLAGTSVARIISYPSRGGLLGRLSQLQVPTAPAVDLVFALGGVALRTHRPVVALSQNLVPFDRAERARYGPTPARLRFEVLRILMGSTFRRAAGVLFLTEGAKARVLADTGPIRGLSTVVPHGVSERFFADPRPQEPLSNYSDTQPFRFLYVSTVSPYKHQWAVVDAVANMRRRGMPVSLDLVGRAERLAEDALRRSLRNASDQGSAIRYLGPSDYETIERVYLEADAFVFASTCESMPNILVEAMAAGLPIANSNVAPMPEVLGRRGVTFNPLDAVELEAALTRLANDPTLRTLEAAASIARARTFSWEACARDTFAFLAACGGVADVRAPTT